MTTVTRSKERKEGLRRDGEEQKTWERGGDRERERRGRKTGEKEMLERDAI